MDNEAYQVSTPLFRAITTGDTASVQQLLNAGADPNESYGADEETALLVAAVERREKIVELLLAAGANPNHGDMCGYTPLMGAVCANAEGIVKHLLQAGANPHQKCGCTGANALQDAAIGGHFGIVKTLLEHGVRPDNSENAEGMTALMCAVHALDTDTVRLLIDYGADVHARSSKGDTAAQLLDYRSESLWHPAKLAKARQIRNLLQAQQATKALI